jgi:hypothetical protein
LEDLIDLGAHSAGCCIHPELINMFVSRDYVIKASHDIIGSDICVLATLEECSIDVSRAGPSSMIINVGEGRYVKTAGLKLTSVTFAVHITG